MKSVANKSTVHEAKKDQAEYYLGLQYALHGYCMFDLIGFEAELLAKFHIHLACQFLGRQV